MEARFSAPVQTCPGAHPASCIMGTAVFPRGKERAGRDATSTPPMGRTAFTQPQCLYSTVIPLLPLWAIRPAQSLSACTRVHFTVSYNFDLLILTSWSAENLPVCQCITIWATHSLSLAHGVLTHSSERRDVSYKNKCEVRIEYFVVSGFSREADENWGLLSHYAASSGNFLPTFRDKTICVIFKGHLEDEASKLSRNACKKLPLLAA